MPVDNIPPVIAAPLIAILWIAVMYVYLIRPWRQTKKDNK